MPVTEWATGALLPDELKVHCLGDEREWLVIFDETPEPFAKRLFLRYMVNVEEMLPEDALEILSEGTISYRVAEKKVDPYYPDDWYLYWDNDCKPNCKVTILDRG